MRKFLLLSLPLAAALASCSVTVQTYVDDCLTVIFGALEFDRSTMSFYSSGMRVEVGPPPCPPVTYVRVRSSVDWDDDGAIGPLPIGLQVEQPNPGGGRSPVTTGQITGSAGIGSSGRPGSFVCTYSVYTSPLDPQTGEPTGFPAAANAAVVLF